MPLFSIVTVAFNSVSTIEDTIISLLSQSFHDYEYILIDGGSTDGTVEIIRKYENRISFWCSEKDAGIYHAMNKGLTHCNGRFVAMLNSDDWYEPNTLELAAKLIEKNPHADLICGAVQFWRDGKKDLCCQSTLDGFSRSMTVFHPTTFIANDAHKQLGNYSLKFRLASDYDMLLRLWLAKKQFVFCNEVFSNMRLSGVSERNWTDSLKDASRVKLQYFPASKVWFQFADMYLRDVLVRSVKALGLEKMYKQYKNRKSGYATYVS